MEQYIKKSAIVAEIKDLYENIDKCIGDLILARSKHDQHGISDAHWKMETLMVNTQQVLSYILDTLETKEVDEEYNGKAMLHVLEKGVEQGKREILNNLWKSAGGDDLPEIDREVIALVLKFGHYKVVFAHRVDENAEVHTSIDGKPLVLHPMRYDKDGWNQPNVKWWLDLELLKMEE